MDKIRFMTIREAGKAGPLTSYRLRIMQKQGKLPGVYAGNRFLVNYNMLLDMLNSESRDTTTKM